ncbi:hypothetical protein [Anaerocolumna sedimenticola]|uniref:hypothetical protein n=1 Tax=Anaerocolumna sedimenticola TaxID=2696063 RepID=UPI00192A3860|nr:hypothetical protein [Anaerocolumna sedimenticola]
MYVLVEVLTCDDFAAEIYYDKNPDAGYMELWLPLSSSQRIFKIKETWDKSNGTQKPRSHQAKAASFLTVQGTWKR